MTEKEIILEKLMSEYSERFDDQFPTIPLIRRGADICISIIKNCLKQNKNVYELGYIQDDDDIEF